MDKLPKLKIFIRLLFIQTGWNFVGMQNIGFAFSLLPVLKKLYNNSLLNLAITRHLEYFNTNPYMVGFALGVCAKMEQKASALDETRQSTKYEKIKSLKNAISTTTAAIGDRLFWSLLKPLCFLFALLISVFAVKTTPHHGAFIFLQPYTITTAIVVSLFIYNIFVLFIRWKSPEYGYRYAENKYCGVDFLRWNKIIKTLKKSGFFIILALIPTLTVKIYKIMQYRNIPEGKLPYALIATALFAISFLSKKYSTTSIYLLTLLFFITTLGGIYLIEMGG